MSLKALSKCKQVDNNNFKDTFIRSNSQKKKPNFFLWNSVNKVRYTFVQ